MTWVTAARVSIGHYSYHPRASSPPEVRKTNKIQPFVITVIQHSIISLDSRFTCVFLFLHSPINYLLINHYTSAFQFSLHLCITFELTYVSIRKASWASKQHYFVNRISLLSKGDHNTPFIHHHLIHYRTNKKKIKKGIRMKLTAVKLYGNPDIETRAVEIRDSFNFPCFLFFLFYVWRRRDQLTIHKQEWFWICIWKIMQSSQCLCVPQ